MYSITPLISSFINKSYYPLHSNSHYFTISPKSGLLHYSGFIICFSILYTTGHYYYILVSNSVMNSNLLVDILAL